MKLPYACAAGFGIGVVATVPAMFLAYLSTGLGHGSYLFAKLLFPYSMCLTSVTGGRISDPLMVLAFAQFPLYGVLIALGPRFGASRLTMAGIVCALHIVAALAAFVGASNNF